MGTQMYKIINGNQIEMTTDEITALEKDRVNTTAEIKTINDAFEKKKQNTISGKQKLKALGLTDDEVEALL